jgi:hypothetical protein
MDELEAISPDEACIFKQAGTLNVGKSPHNFSYGRLMALEQWRHFSHVKYPMAEARGFYTVPPAERTR